VVVKKLPPVPVVPVLKQYLVSGGFVTTVNINGKRNGFTVYDLALIQTFAKSFILLYNLSIVLV
jgi:hypothetical protein